MVSKTICRDESAHHSSSRDKVNGAVWAIMPMFMMSLVATERLQEMLQSMRHQIKASKEEENRHGKPSKNFCSLETKRVPNTAAPPNLEIAQDIYHDTDSSTTSIEKDKMRESGSGKRSF